MEVRREAAGAQAGCFSGETRNQLEDRRGVHQGTVCWCLSWLQDPDPIVASERDNQPFRKLRRYATEHLTSDLRFRIGAKKTWQCSIPQKHNSSTFSIRYNLPDNYSVFFNDTQLSPPPSTLNISGLSFTYNLDWKLHITPLLKTASLKLGVIEEEVQHINNTFTELGYPKGILADLKDKARRVLERRDREKEQKKNLILPGYELMQVLGAALYAPRWL
ncbi:hypothetical protein E2C01_043652 [Portunus trituberculatus]|uniref:Uncharacterized protein n=1 Tax=Portunus trituberculatus TaxID=210409 RepID=A0A5B7FWN7_PORTR|nr:hypothetical protein [Portunus trituberculatus]